MYSSRTALADMVVWQRYLPTIRSATPAPGPRHHRGRPAPPAALSELIASMPAVGLVESCPSRMMSHACEVPLAACPCRQEAESCWVPRMLFHLGKTRVPPRELARRVDFEEGPTELKSSLTIRPGESGERAVSCTRAFGTSGPERS